MAIVMEHQGRRPRIHDSAYVAATAVLCGDVVVGASTCVLSGRCCRLKAAGWSSARSVS